MDGTIKIAHRSSAEEERNNRAIEAIPSEGGTRLTKKRVHRKWK